MTSKESLSHAADWPAGMPARAAWLQRLRWLPAACRTMREDRHGGLWLATSAWLKTLARRPDWHAKVIRRSLGIWSSCAMDWQALGQQQAGRGAGRIGSANAGVAAQAGQVLVHWRISERTIVQQGAIGHAATPATTPRAASRSASSATEATMPPAAAVGVAGRSSELAGNAPAMSYVLSPPHHDAPMPARSATPPENAMAQQLPHGVIAAAPVGTAGNAPAMSYVLSPPHHDAPMPARSATPPENAMAQQLPHGVIAAAPVGAAGAVGNAPAMTYVLSPPRHDAAAPAFFAAPSGRTAARQQSTLAAVVQQARAMTIHQARSSRASPGASSRDAAGWPTPLAAASATGDGSASPSLGDLLYDQAMRELHDASRSRARGETPETAALPLRLDLARARQDAPAAVLASPEVHAHANDRRDNPGNRDQSQRAASGASDVADAADAPLRRGDIDQVAQRVMRLIAREQRRERESKGRR